MEVQIMLYVAVVCTIAALVWWLAGILPLPEKVRQLTALVIGAIVITMLINVLFTLTGKTSWFLFNMMWPAIGGS